VNADKPTILVPETIGLPFEGGFYGGQINSHGGKKIFAVVWAPKAFGEVEKIWLPSYKEVPNARSCFHSMDNTRAMAEAGSPLAQWALGLDIEGRKDWCIPARDVLELAYRHLKPTGYETGAYFRDGDNPSSVPVGYPYSQGDKPAQTAVESFREGGAEAFEEAWYWSSTQHSGYGAWSQSFGSGLQDADGEPFEARARAVRMVQLNP
jgi:hypothetical protein